MPDTYLPADVRKRIVDVMRGRKMPQRELALRIDVNESTISRFLSGKTEKLSEEIHTAMQMIDERDKAYLWYRFGFEDDVLHPLNETARHFHLSESRAKSTEKMALDNFWLELPWWF